MVCIEHSAPKVRFDHTGISLKMWPFSICHIRWSDVDFLSPTPIYERVEGHWQPQKTPEYLLASIDKDPVQALVQSGILELKVVIHNRHILPRWMRVPIGSIYVRPLYDSNDRPESKLGVITLQLRTYKLSGSVNSLFDLISEHARFGLITSGA